jgi:methionyl-tRNA formyltransferase
MSAPALRCVFLGYLWKVARAIQRSTQAELIAVGVEPQRSRSAEAIEYYRNNQIPFFDAARSAPSRQLEETLDAGIDLLVVGAFGRILPPAIVQAPRLGTINVHCSLLPAYRGGCPIEEQILAGETRGGVTLHWMTGDVDAGPILAAAPSIISPDDAYADVFERCHANAELLLADVLTREPSGWQRTAQVTSTPIRKPRCADDGIVDWNRSAVEIRRLVLADGWRGWVRSRLPDGDIVLERVAVSSGDLDRSAPVPGRVRSGGPFPTIETGHGVITLEKWAAPRPLVVGEVLASKASA